MMTRFTLMLGELRILWLWLNGLSLSAGTYFIIIPIMLSISWRWPLLLAPSSLILVPLVTTKPARRSVTNKRWTVFPALSQLKVRDAPQVTNKSQSTFPGQNARFSQQSDRLCTTKAFGRLSITIMSLTAALVIEVWLKYAGIWLQINYCLATSIQFHLLNRSGP